MAIATVAEFLAALRQTQLVEPARLDPFDGPQERTADPALLADALVRRGLVTPLQAEYVLQGRARELTLGPYLLLEQLGKGGMGEVFRARQARLDRIVALKIIRPEQLSHPDAIKRFGREAKAAAKLQHPNVVTIYDADEAGGVFFIAMECVDGIDLARLVRRQGPLPVHEACAYARQAALGLQHAHEHGLVHRDIKPSNLIVTRTSAPDGSPGLVKVLDFGLARFANALPEDGTLTPTDQWIGTPDFIAPEQAQNSKDVDIRADIFSLGCALYYLLTGKSAFGGGNRMEKLVARLTNDVTPVSTFRHEVSPRLDAVLIRMLARSPADRFQSPAEAARALEPFCQADAVFAGPAPLLAAGTVNPDKPTVTAAQAFGEAMPRLDGQGSSDLTPPLAPAAAVVPTPSPAPSSATSVWPKPLTRRLVFVGAASLLVILAVLLAVPYFLPKNAPVVVPPPTVPTVPPDSFVNSIGMKLMRIPAGAFLMGAPKDEAEHGEDEVPQHAVEIKQPFFLGAYEVTQGEYQAIFNANPSHFSLLGAGAAQLEGVADTGKYPVESVTWDEAVEFCTRLTQREQRDGRTYRLPTEAEWEYACRAKTTTPFHLGRMLSAADANFNGRAPYGGALAGAARQHTLPVGSFRANAFGLFDMHGNVWEWCQDRWTPYADKLKPGGAEQSFGRVTRGGAWNYQGADCRSAKRTFRDQDSRSPHVGFRVVCEP